MRISDWSPDVCSSDLENSAFGRREDRRAFVVGDADGEGATLPRPFDGGDRVCGGAAGGDTQQDVVRADEHTSELQSLMRISYAVFCLKKKIRPRNSTKKVISQV